MDLILNELSFEPLASNAAEASSRVDTLVSVLVAASQRGVSNTLRTTANVTEKSVAYGITLSSWLSDGKVDTERRRRLRAAITKAPYVEELLQQVARPDDALDVCIDGKRCLSATLAYQLDSPLVSFDTAPWSGDPLDATREFIEFDDVQKLPIKLCNLHSDASVERRTSWLRERLEKEVETGAQLVSRASELLPQVDFAHNARDQLARLAGSERVFRFVVQHLFALNDRAVRWSSARGQPFSTDYRFRCSDESEATLAQYSSARTFLCPDGQRRCFSMHSKISQDAWRVHFIADAKTFRVLVGYVGPHLPTATG